MQNLVPDLHQRRSGFTLIELSIALVIIGLIVGGVFVGMDLIRAAETRSILKDIERFQSAMNTFRIKYNCLPGDCLNATDFMGTDSNGCPLGGGATGTCNGDSNGHIGNFQFPVEVAAGESFRAWQQLQFAGLVAGNYSGIAGPGGARDVVGGLNSPASKVNNTAYEILWFTAVGNDRYDTQVASHFLMFGDYSGVYEPDGVAIPVSQAYAMDVKYDDGKPGKGSIISTFVFLNNGTIECVTAGTSTTATYNSTANARCALSFKVTAF